MKIKHLFEEQSVEDKLRHLWKNVSPRIFGEGKRHIIRKFDNGYKLINSSRSSEEDLIESLNRGIEANGDIDSYIKFRDSYYSNPSSIDGVAFLFWFSTALNAMNAQWDVTNIKTITPILIREATDWLDSFLKRHPSE